MKGNSIDGKDLMLWIGGIVVALSTTCSVEVNANTEDSGTKDDGIWDASNVTGLSWNLSNESVAAKDNAATAQSYKELLKKMLAKEPIDVTFGIPTNQSDNGVPEAGWTAPTDDGYKGEALITSLKLDAAKGSKAKITVSLKGVGALEPMTTAA